MFVHKYGIHKLDIHSISCNFTYTNDKMSAAEKATENNETTKPKKEKKGCELIELFVNTL